jgi:hypothetical protein
MHPIVTPPIPGSSYVVSTPIIAEAERHDADAERGTHREYGNAPVLIVVQ